MRGGGSLGVNMRGYCWGREGGGGGGGGCCEEGVGQRARVCVSWGERAGHVSNEHEDNYLYDM